MADKHVWMTCRRGECDGLIAFLYIEYGQQEEEMSIVDNRKARFNYQVLDTYEAGIVLLGSEVKALRAGKVNIAESYVDCQDGEIWLVNSTMEVLSTTKRGGVDPHEPRRRRKLLLHKREIVKLAEAVARKGMTIIPLSLYWKEGRAKISIGLAKGKNSYDKKETLKNRTLDREMNRLKRGDKRDF